MVKENILDTERLLLLFLAENEQLKKEIAELRARLTKYEQPEKDSHNSSIAPSQQSIKVKSIQRTKSQRPKSDRPNGGQIGHKGVTLLANYSPDQTVVHSCDYCRDCGKSLSDIEGEEAETRQSQDIPLPVRLTITNHVAIEKKCTCGCRNRGDFPATVKNGVSYGPNIHAVVAYLNTIQHIPFKRLKQTLWDCFGVNLSEGTISKILNRMRKQSDGSYEHIRQLIETTLSVGADETGAIVNGKLHWMWVFQTLALTYIFCDKSRGKAAIDKVFPNGLPQSVLTTDRHRSYFNMELLSHQLCLAHLLRNLTFLSELDTKQKWSEQMLELLRDSIHTRKTTPFEQIDKQHFRDRLDKLLKQDVGSFASDFQTIQKSLINYQDYLFKFLEYDDVPYDNNASERAVRPLKVKQKVSGQFKTDNGSDTFCQLFSIAHTAQKNGQSPFLAMLAIANNC